MYDNENAGSGDDIIYSNNNNKYNQKKLPLKTTEK